MSENREYPKEAGIYKLTCVNNGKIYIGKSINIHTRINSHKNCSNKMVGKCYFENAIIKHGWDSFNVEILEIFNNFDKLKDNNDLLKRESYYIDTFGSTDVDKGYNICKYSQDATGRKHTEESKQKMRKPKSEEHKLHMRKPMTEDRKNKIRQSKIGKKMSIETKDKISSTHKGMVRSEEHRSNIGKSRLGTFHSDEAKHRMSLASKGKPKSEEHKAKLRLAQQKRKNNKNYDKA